MPSTRERLAAAQAELVRALVAQGPVPAGFDDKRLRAATRSLVSKRWETVARVWPNLPTILGDAYVEKFRNYALSQPLPPCAIPLADGRAFLTWLDAREPLHDSLRMEAVLFDMRFVVTPTGVRPRRGFAFRRVRLSDTTVLAARLPWLGERWWRIPKRR
jgi:hypothetical protein